jgi:hypothetical protein
LTARTDPVFSCSLPEYLTEPFISLLPAIIKGDAEKREKTLPENRHGRHTLFQESGKRMNNAGLSWSDMVYYTKKCFLRCGKGGRECHPGKMPLW